jgi:hypothetical protein
MRHAAHLLFGALLLAPPLGADDAEMVSVRHPEGLVHGFLALRTLTGDTLANGDLIQDVKGDRVTSQLVFHFRDGSLHDETAVFTQRKQFRLVTYELVQKGAAFPRPVHVSVEGASGKTTVRYTDKGEEKFETADLKGAAGLANGMLPILLKNVPPQTAKTTLGFLAVTPKPMTVNLEIKPAGAETFKVAGSPRKATHYVVHVDIKGLAGVVAPLIGKEPPDSHVWILQGQAPAFIKSEGPLFAEGPLWRIELTSPTW